MLLARMMITVRVGVRVRCGVNDDGHDGHDDNSKNLIILLNCGSRLIAATFSF